MFVKISPGGETYSSNDFQWVYDESRHVLQPAETIEAACRIPAKLLARPGNYQLSVPINRGVYPPNSHGRPLRGDEWWTGVVESPPLRIEVVSR